MIGAGTTVVVGGGSLRTLPPPPPPPQAVRTRQEEIVVARSERFIGGLIPVMARRLAASHQRLAQWTCADPDRRKSLFTCY